MSFLFYSCDTAKFSEQSRVIKERYLKSGYQWMAREILLGEPPNQQTDIYSLCVVIWEMLHGNYSPEYSCISAITLVTKYQRILLMNSYVDNYEAVFWAARSEHPPTTPVTQQILYLVI